MIHFKYMCKFELKWMHVLIKPFICVIVHLKVFKERCYCSRKKSGGTDGAAERRAGTHSGCFNHRVFHPWSDSIGACCSLQEKIKSAVNLTKSVDLTRAHLQGQLRNKEAENNRLTVQMRVLYQTVNMSWKMQNSVIHPRLFSLWREPWLSKRWRSRIWTTIFHLWQKKLKKSKNLWRKLVKHRSWELRNSKLPSRNATMNWKRRYDDEKYLFLIFSILNSIRRLGRDTGPSTNQCPIRTGFQKVEKREDEEWNGQNHS